MASVPEVRGEEAFVALVRRRAGEDTELTWRATSLAHSESAQARRRRVDATARLLATTRRAGIYTELPELAAELFERAATGPIKRSRSA